MAPKRKELPEDDIQITIFGLRTLRSKGMSLEGMAQYYSGVFDESYSRRTVKREIDRIDGVQQRVLGKISAAEGEGKASGKHVRSAFSKSRQNSGGK